MSFVAAVLVGVCTVWSVLGMLAVLRVRFGPAGRRSGSEVRDTAPLLPVTVLKPLCGADAALEQNLTTF